MVMKALTTATDEESALSNRADDKPTSSGPLEKVDELAGLMGGMDMALNFLANQSGDPQFLDAWGDLFLERFQGTGKEADIDNAISAYELAIGTMSTDHEKYGAYTGTLAWHGSNDSKRLETFTILIEQFLCWKFRCLSHPRVTPTRWDGSMIFDSHSSLALNRLETSQTLRTQ